MRRSILTAAILIVATALPVCAQRRVVSAPRASASVGVRSSGRVIVNGGFAVRHNPGFGVFVNPRPFHPRRFYYPYAYAYPYSYPYAIYPYTAYPYYGVGLQSDFVYSNSAVGTYSAPAYMADHDTGVQSDLYRLQAELDQVRRERAVESQQYALNPPAPPPVARSRPEQPAPATVLIYRDGHQAEVHNYAVVGQVLWIFTEERARKVPLADLDLDASRKANEERGVDFAVQAKPAEQ